MERVKSRRVMKTRRAQIEMVDWALERRTLLELLRLKEDGSEGEGVEEEAEEVEEEEEEVEEESLLLLSTMALALALELVLLSSGKKTRSKPIPQFSPLLLGLLLMLLGLALAVKPMSLFVILYVLSLSLSSLFSLLSLSFSRLVGRRLGLFFWLCGSLCSHLAKLTVLTACDPLVYGLASLAL